MPEARLAVRSAAFPAVPGRVVRCDVERRRGDDVPVFSLNLAYAYEVGGDAFVGTRLGAGAIATSDRGWHERAAAALRPGTAVTVFHDPANPAVSLLEPGVTGGHLFLALFLTPFTTLIPAGGLGFVRLIVGDAAGPRDDGDGLRRWDTGGGPAWVAAGRAAVGTALAVTFAGSLGTAFTAGFRPPAWVPAGWFALAALIGGAAANVRYRRRAGGADDVVVDQKRRLLALPIAHGRKAAAGGAARRAWRGWSPFARRTPAATTAARSPSASPRTPPPLRTWTRCSASPPRNCGRPPPRRSTP